MPRRILTDLLELAAVILLALAVGLQVAVWSVPAGYAAAAVALLAGSWLIQRRTDVSP